MIVVIIATMIKKTTMRLLSILIPVYNEAECVGLLYERLIKMAETMPCDVEFWFVNDGSRDHSLALIKQLQDQDGRVAYIDLSRNYGKEIAMCAGIDFVCGDTLVVMDADLQHPPELIPVMYEELQKGYDDVYGLRMNRKGESWLKRWASKRYYKMLQNFSRIPIQENAGDFRMFSRKAIDALRQLKENERNMKALFSYIGFKKKAVAYEVEPRIAGKTKWNWFQLTDLGIKGLTSFSTVPLRVISFMGFIISFFSFVYMMYVIIKAMIFGDPVIGFPSLMAVLLFLGGVILLALGIIGEYIGVIYNESKKRPVYFINEYKKTSKSL